MYHFVDDVFPHVSKKGMCLTIRFLAIQLKQNLPFHVRKKYRDQRNAPDPAFFFIS